MRKQRSSLGRVAVVHDAHGYRLYLPGPYLVWVHERRHPEAAPPAGLGPWPGPPPRSS